MKFKYSNINNLLSDYKEEKVSIEEVINYTKHFLNEANEKYNVLIKIDEYENKWDEYINSQIQTLNELKKSEEDLFEKYPLFGVPLIAKDNTDIIGFPTTSGSKFFIDNVATKTAPAIQKFIDLGAIVVAKSNLSEFSGGAKQYGISELGGKTTNIINKDYDTSGSSSGAGVLASLGLPLCIGTETNGSIIHPSMRNDVFGLKPNRNDLSIENIMPLNTYLDTVGFLSKDLDNIDYLTSLVSVEEESNKEIKVAYEHAKIFNSTLDFFDKEKSLEALNKVKQNIHGEDLDLDDMAYIQMSSINWEFTAGYLTESFNGYIDSKYDLNEYFEYAKKSDDFVEMGWKDIDTSKMEKYNQESLELFKNQYGDYDVIIGLGVFASFMSVMSRYPSLYIPYNFDEKNGFSGISIIGKNELNVLKIAKQIVSDIL